MPDYSICRICLMEDANGMQPLFESSAKCREIVRQIEECGGIVLKSHEEFPKMICIDCLALLKSSCRFRAMCQASENALLDAMVKSELKIEPADGDSTQRSETEVFFDMHSEFIDAEEVDFADMQESEEAAVDFDSSYEDDSHEIDAIEISGDVHDFVLEDNELIDSDCSESLLADKKTKVKSIKLAQNTATSSTDMASVLEKKKVGRPRLNSGGKAKITSINRTRKKIEEEPASIMCEICGNIYSKRSLLNMHMRRHMANKPFDCEICGKAFACPSEIGRHMRVHTGEKPYSCKFCGRTFADRSTNIKHERIHTNERPFTCNTCGKSFTYSNVLKNHMLTHTGEKPFSCLACNKTFSRKHQLDQHCSTITHQQTIKSLEAKAESFKQDHQAEMEEQLQLHQSYTPRHISSTVSPSHNQSIHILEVPEQQEDVELSPASSQQLTGRASSQSLQIQQRHMGETVSFTVTSAGSPQEFITAKTT